MMRDALSAARWSWSPGRATLVQVVALIAPVAAMLVLRGEAAFRLLAAVLLVTLIAEMAFALVRARPFSWHGAAAAMVVAVMLPPDLPVWEAGLAMAFGVVLADLVFGGRGFGFLAAPVVALSFLMFSFPQVALATPGGWIALAVLPGAALLLATGLASWRVLLTAVAVYVLTELAGGAVPAALPTLGAVAFGARLPDGRSGGGGVDRCRAGALRRAGGLFVECLRRGGSGGRPRTLGARLRHAGRQHLRAADRPCGGAGAGGTAEAAHWLTGRTRGAPSGAGRTTTG